MKFIPSFLALAALFSARALAADRLFLFDGPSATVLEAPDLATVGNLTVGPGAFAAFRVSGRTYIVAEDRITVVGEGLRPRAEIALSDASATAAALDPLTWNLLVAAGGRLYRIDTQVDRIASIVETGVEPSAIVIPGDSRVAYLMTAGSRQAKVVDLESDRVLPGAADLAAIPGVFAGALIGSGGEIFSAEPSPAGIAGLAKNRTGAHALLAASPSGARLLRSNHGLTHIAPDGSMTPLEDLTAPLLHAGLSPEGDTAYLALADGRVVALDTKGKKPAATVWTASAPTAMALVSDPPQQVTITKVSGDLQSVIAGDDFQLVVTGPIGGIPMTVESDSPAAECETVPPLSGNTTITCSSNPVSVTTTVTLTVSAIGTPVTFTVFIFPAGLSDGLFKISGDNQVVDAGDDFALVVEARLGGLPRANAELTVTDDSAVVDCPDDDLVTNASGRATINCEVAGSVPASDTATITVSDGTNFVQFTANITGQTGPSNGLVRITPNPVTVFEGLDFDLTVEATLDDEPQPNVALTVTTSNNAVDCPALATTGVDGRATLECDADPVSADVLLQVTITDGTRTVTYSVTVKNATVVDGFQKISGDNQVVPPNTLFPQPLVVYAAAGGEPDESLLLTVTVSNAAATCSVSTLTDTNGLASISCAANSVAANTLVQIQVKDAANRTLAQPFTATIAPNQSGGEAEAIVVLSGANLTARAGDTLAEAIQVRTETDSGGIVGGANVFARGPQGVTLEPAVVQSNPNGLAVFDVSFGCAPASGQIELGLASNTIEATVNYTLSSGPLSQFVKTQGDNQTGPPGQRLPLALVVRSADQCGSALPSIPVAWTVVPPEAATLEAVLSTTNGQGLASALVRPSTRGGAYQVRVAAVQDAAIAATFSLTTQNVASQLQIVSGNEQNVPAGTQAASPLVVRALNAASQPVQGVAVAFQVTSGSGTLGSASTVTDAQGRATTTFTAGVARGPVTVRATGAAQTVEFRLTVGGGAPQLQIPGFVNGASFLPGLVAGSTGSIFGVNITGDVSGAVVAPYDPLNGFPTLFRGVRVTIAGIAAPILGLANVNGTEQINIQVPFGLAQGVVRVVVENNGTQSSIDGIPVFGIQPGIFEYSLGSNRYAAVLHANYDPVTPQNPARPGEVLLLFVTGLGGVTPPVPTNQAGPVSPLSVPVQLPRVQLDGIQQQIEGAWYAPQLLSVYQVNFRLSTAVQPGSRTLVVSVDGSQSQQATLPVAAAF